MFNSVLLQMLSEQKPAWEALDAGDIEAFKAFFILLYGPIKEIFDPEDLRSRREYFFSRYCKASLSSVEIVEKDLFVALDHVMGQEDHPPIIFLESLLRRLVIPISPALEAEIIRTLRKFLLSHPNRDSICPRLYLDRVPRAAELAAEFRGESQIEAYFNS